ncbi:MAG: B12-binding domain-containing radical SAM protein [Deltaproteobacteria bacterium]|nr:B12-binding domain-containing radical SAM protein [Deltaproteobacteria bacterium]
MADVLLINANTWNGTPPSYLPAGVLSIAAFVRGHGISVEILDRNVNHEDPSDFFRKVQPKIIGISVLTGPVILDAIKLSKLAKSILKDVKIVWGGLHPTIFSSYVLAESYVDYIIKGEGEYAFFDLVNHILSGVDSPEKIQNLGYREGNAVKLNPERSKCDFQKLPFPAWDLLKIQNLYKMKKFYSNSVVSLYTSRGCPWRCAFCYIQSTNQRKFRALTAEQIVDQMEYFEYNWGIHGFQFYDDEFDVSEERVLEMCDILIKKKKKYKFSHFSRIDHINLNRLLLEKEAGLNFIEFGIESGSDRILKFLQKDTDSERIRYAFDVCKKAGVHAGALFMIGIPTEQSQEVDQTVSILKEINPHQCIGTIYKPYPATPLYDYCIRNQLFTMPQTLQEQGEVFGLGEFSMNMSHAPMSKLKAVYNHFYLRNIFNEVKNCLVFGNFKLLSFYFYRRFLSSFTTLMKRQFMLIFSENSIYIELRHVFIKNNRQAKEVHLVS